jgi:hypothetical protein
MCADASLDDFIARFDPPTVSPGANVAPLLRNGKLDRF